MRVYVDALNLYYGALKVSPYKWLNVRRFAELLFPGQRVELVRYFYTPVKGGSASRRQGVYTRALQTVVGLTLHKGHFLTNPDWMPVDAGANVLRLWNNGAWQPMPRPAPGHLQFMATNTEEKGSDVNLASFLLRDAFKNLFDCAAVVSGDSDLVTPIELVFKELKLPVVVFNPYRSRVSRELLGVASGGYASFTDAVLAASQFPKAMTDKAGLAITKPLTW